jgi:hypothetical protein
MGRMLGRLHLPGLAVCKRTHVQIDRLYTAHVSAPMARREAQSEYLEATEHFYEKHRLC